MLPEKIKVSVTWDDINNGIPCCSKNCMLAKAVKRALIDTDFKLILVGRNWIYIKQVTRNTRGAAMEYQRELSTKQECLIEAGEK